WQRQKIQKLLWTIILLIIHSSALLSGVAIYGHYSPSLPLMEHWFDYVDEYPTHEIGVTLEFPGISNFKWRIEADYTPFPKAGIISEGHAFWLSAGFVINNSINDRLNLYLGPQFTLGWTSAKGTYDYIDTDSTGYYIDFDGNGNGLGISMIAGAVYKISSNIRIGLEPSIIYFGLKQDDVPITGRDASDPEAPPDHNIFIYKGEYVAFSFRVFTGFEF
ncbi:hypothetical protein KAH81_06540, partial [bacterium]|nr:hypothetical protein [bacterium]